MYLGGCKCQSIRYRFIGEPMTCYACHCTDCQTSTGSAFAMSMVIHTGDIEVIEGEPATKALHDNDRAVQRTDCVQCGTELWFTANTYPHFMALKPGTFDDTSWVQPIAHIWVSEAQSWINLGTDTATYAKHADLSELMDLWASAK